MHPIRYIDRTTGDEQVEKVFGAWAIALLYGDGIASTVIGTPLRYLCACTTLLSRLYGLWQKQRWTRRRIAPFVKAYDIDATEFASAIDEFPSFNDFFIRKLNSTARPIATGGTTAIIPADGRYWLYQDIAAAASFPIKGKKFDLMSLLRDSTLAERYRGGSAVIARLCPSDYHRFHFTVDGVPGPSRLINGFLYSVNPIAIRKKGNILNENRRVLTEIDSDNFGNVLVVEVGATNVGSIRQTYSPGQHYRKGDEKGYFEFGGSALLLLFQKGRITFDSDLIALSRHGLEIRCLMGQQLGRAPEVSVLLV